jgi:hypothetical protein
MGKIVPQKSDCGTFQSTEMEALRVGLVFSLKRNETIFFLIGW